MKRQGTQFSGAQNRSRTTTIICRSGTMTTTWLVIISAQSRAAAPDHNTQYTLKGRKCAAPNKTQSIITSGYRGVLQIPNMLLWSAPRTHADDIQTKKHPKIHTRARATFALCDVAQAICARRSTGSATAVCFSKSIVRCAHMMMFSAPNALRRAYAYTSCICWTLANVYTQKHAYVHSFTRSMQVIGALEPHTHKSHTL